ncbi:hypothetical protein KUTeg_013970 [Tegillarca granosa]|uniref:DDE-1 domain-containing protein n=1 Tax=Tegillarca granosa TaxID=220873 RepID=A0ABQ9EV81_TEGGR|nr:hypothetical protein KUTeg_013970 [Tegillarca granosa]
MLAIVEMNPLGAKYTYQKKAWMEDILGVSWFKDHFLKHCGPERPQIIILDSQFWEWPRLFKEAYIQTVNPANITEGFRVCGIYPFNPKEIPTSAFAPSLPFSSQADTPSIATVEEASSVQEP